MGDAPLMEIAGRAVGPGQPVYVVAEMSSNHRQRLDEAEAIVRAAAAAGADAVKLQTYTADTITIDCDAPLFRIPDGTWGGRTLHGLYAEACTPWEWHAHLKAVANDLGLHLFSAPFDPTAVDFLERLAVPVYKVASFEIVDLPLIERIARTGRPLIISTGLATLEDVAAAVDAARKAGARQLALLKCTSAYPASPDDMHLRALELMADTFGVPVGLSDHTLGTSVATAAVALGASIVEKHLTLSRAAGGPDAGFSLEPDEFAQLVRDIRVVERALGDRRLAPSVAEQPNLMFRRSLFVVADVKAGERFTEANVRSIRPANGLPPRHLGSVLGRRAARDVARGTPLAWDLIANG